MVKQIGNILLSGHCESIKNWDIFRSKFRDGTSTMWAHETSKETAQTKKEIDDKVNSLLIGKGSNKRIANGKAKTVCVFKSGVQEDENRSEDCVPFKVWKMLTFNSHAVLHQGDNIKIGLVKDNAVKTSKTGRGGMSAHHKKIWGKFLHISHLEDWKKNLSYTKELYDFIALCNAPL